MKFLVETKLLPDVVSDHFLAALLGVRGHSAYLFRVANSGVQIGDLVGIHAWGRHFDGTGPIEVVVTKGKCQLLELNLGQGRLIERHIEVGWSLTSLGALDWDKEKIELFLSRAAGFDKVTVDDATTGRVVEAVVAIHDKEVLDDALVDNHKSNLGLDSCLVVHLIAGLGELSDLGVNDLLALSGTDTVTVDDDVSWEVVLVVLGKLFNAFLECSLHLGGHNFLTLLLHEEVRIVLTHLFVVRGDEADD